MRLPNHALCPAQLASIALGCLVLSGAALAGPSTARAQSWLADRSRAEGPGFRVGDLELHPGVGAEVGWDSNLYYTQDNPPPTISHVDSGILRITPHLLISTVGGERTSEGEATGGDPPTVTFRGGVSAAYYEFFADPNRRNLGLDVGMRLNILPGRPFSFSVFDNFTRSIRPFTENVGRAASAARIGNQAGVDLQFQTTGGIFQVRAGYMFGLDFFEDGAFQYGNSFTHTITVAESFRFLPQTAIVQDNTLTVGDYYASDATLAGAPTLLTDSVRLRTRVGLNGAITNELSLSGMVGYAAGFFILPRGADPAVRAAYSQEYDSIVAQVEARWQVAEGIRLSIGYDRDFFAAFLGNYYSRDRGYANFQALVAGSFLLGIEADVGYLDYGNPINPMGMAIGGGGTDTAHREDVRVSAGLFAEYRFTDWLAVNGTARYTGTFTDFRYDIDTGVGALIPDPASYNKVELFLGVRAFY